MKKAYIYTLFLSLNLLFFSCDSFLEESSLDEVRPTTVDDIRQLLVGEGYPSYANFASYIDLLTDDILSNDPKDSEEFIKKAQAGKSAFMWQADMFEQMSSFGCTDLESWTQLYEKIKGCNVVLDYVDNVIGSKEDKGNVKGQALGLRAYYYFLLANLYGQPYNNKDIDITKSPAVPLILKSEVKDEFPVRNSVKEVYDRVLIDLTDAQDLMEQYGTNNTNAKVSDLFVHMLSSRVSLYMENWNEVIKHCDYVISRRPALTNLTLIKSEDDARNRIDEIMYNSVRGKEVIWGHSFPLNRSLFDAPGMGVTPAFAVSQELEDLYDSNDLRATYQIEPYLIKFDWATFTIIKGMLYGRNTNTGMRTAEAYLNRAEANIRLFIETEDDKYRVNALSDLNYLREYRYDANVEPYQEIDIADAEELLQFCKDERRKELAFENHRWFDLRRYGMPELKHVFKGQNGVSEEAILPAKGDAYVLPIPKTIMDRNPGLEQNKR